MSFNVTTESKISVIIADDQEGYSRPLAFLLKEFNIEIYSIAKNGQELIDQLKIKEPDVVLLDISMPKMDGVQALEIITKEFPEVKTIMLTQYSSEHLVKHLFNKGACGYVTKDMVVEVLVYAIFMVKKRNVFNDNFNELLTNKLSPAKKYFDQLFSPREKEIIVLICNGQLVKEIAGQLNITTNTVEKHLTSIYLKSNTSCKAKFLPWAMEQGLKYLY